MGKAAARWSMSREWWLPANRSSSTFRRGKISRQSGPVQTSKRSSLNALRMYAGAFTDTSWNMPATLPDPSLLAPAADGRSASAGHRGMLQEQRDRERDKKRDEEILSGQDRAVSKFKDLSFLLSRR